MTIFDRYNNFSGKTKRNLSIFKYIEDEKTDTPSCREALVKLLKTELENKNKPTSLNFLNCICSN